MLAGRVEADLRPALHRHLQVVLVRSQEDGVPVHIGRKRSRLLALEVPPCRVVGKRQPARRRDVRRLVDRVDLVFAREALRDDLELRRQKLWM